MLAHLQNLISQSPRRQYGLGATIVYQGEAPRWAYILSKGIVKVLSFSEEGDEQIVAYHVAGEFFPSSWIFDKAPGALFFYEAATNCEIIFVPRQQLIDYMLANDVRMHALLNYMTTNYTASLLRINALQQPKARDKLIYTLYYLAQRYSQNKANRVTLPIALTHQNLASLVGLTRETTSMQINKLRTQKVISYTKQRYTIDCDKLLELIGEEGLNDISIAG